MLLLCCSTLVWKIKSKLTGWQNCTQVQSVGVSVGKPCSLVRCEAIPVDDLGTTGFFPRGCGSSPWSPGRGDDKSCPSCHSGCMLAHQQTAQMRYFGSRVTSPARKSKTAEQCTEEWGGPQRSEAMYMEYFGGAHALIPPVL